MADRNDEHPWGTCDGCGVDLGGVCCYEPHQFGDYDTLCHSCFTAMKKDADERRLIALSRDGHLIDGQHRLRAIRRAK